MNQEHILMDSFTLQIKLLQELVLTVSLPSASSTAAGFWRRYTLSTG